MTDNRKSTDMMHARAAFYEADTFDDFLTMIATRKLSIYAFRPPGATISRARFDKCIRKAREVFGDSEAIGWLDDQMTYRHRPTEEKGTGR